MLLLLFALASASTNFPAEMEGELDMPCQAPCTVCHSSVSGGTGTVVQPFGLAMMDRELAGLSDAGALAAALQRIETDAVDSDADGTIDVDALAGGVDPNTGDSFCEDPLPTPKYGCLSTAQAGEGVLLVLLAVGMGSLRRA